jgi:hypothetical protein
MQLSDDSIQEEYVYLSRSRLSDFSILEDYATSKVTNLMVICARGYSKILKHHNRELTCDLVYQRDRHGKNALDYGSKFSDIMDELYLFTIFQNISSTSVDTALIYNKFIQLSNMCIDLKELIIRSYGNYQENRNTDSTIDKIRINIMDKNDTRFLPVHLNGSYVLGRGLINIRFKDNIELSSNSNTDIDNINNLIYQSRLRNIGVWQMFSTFIFEICNMNNFEGQTINQCKDCDEYAEMMENLEYQTLIDHHTIAMYGITKCGWHSIIDKYANPKAIFAAQEHRGHTQFYRDQFSILMTDKS